ncbi:hypothetical protein KEM52_005637 [Ascosphaera acerosa]|nr:hypothetical protein KEM52_005637 [Ascosphaera acerosa]
MDKLPPLDTSFASSSHVCGDSNSRPGTSSSTASKGQQSEASFASSPKSVHEEEFSNIPQTFESTSPTSRQPTFRIIPGTEAFSNTGAGDMGTAIYNTAALAPPPPPPRFFCACSTFKGWKNIPIAGKRASKSFSDLRVLTDQNNDGWLWEIPRPVQPTLRGQKDAIAEHAEHEHESHYDASTHLFVPGQDQPQKRRSRAPIEKLSVELLNEIIRYLVIDIPPNGYTPRNVDLISCLLTCRTLHACTLSVLYENITIPHSTIFSKFLSQIRRYPGLQSTVRRLDFSHFTSVGLGRTMEMNAKIQNLTSATLYECLALIPNLREALFQEHLEGDLSPEVIYKVLADMPRLQAVDFCACSSASFSDAFLQAVSLPSLPSALSIRRLSLHECSSLDASVFGNLLARLPHLTHLDLAHTQITNEALFSIPTTARLTHLNLARCIKLTGDGVINFLTEHPAACENSLVYLNLMTDVTRSRILGPEQADTLLRWFADEPARCEERDSCSYSRRHETPALRSLNIGGAKGLTLEHIPLLRKLCTWVEELGLANGDFRIEEISELFRTDTFADVEMVDVDDGGGASPNPPPPALALRYIDLTATPGLTHTMLVNPNTSTLATEKSAPLVVVELSEYVTKPLRDRQSQYPGASKYTLSPLVAASTSSPLTDVKLSARYGNGWVVRELGRRAWYVRGPGAKGAAACGIAGSGCDQWSVDDGWRWWKMGAKWWGMRKIPVAVEDVGGLYGHYMFKR